MADQRNEEPHGSSKNLRNKSDQYKFKISLIGSPPLTLSGSKLPTKQKILGRFIAIRQEFELIGKKKRTSQNSF